MSSLSSLSLSGGDDDLDETTDIDAKYAIRIDRGAALSLFDFPDIKHQPTNFSMRGQDNETTDDENEDEDGGVSLIQGGGDEENTLTLLSLPGEIRDSIWRFVLLANTPDTIKCRHCYPRSRTTLINRPSRKPRLCFGLPSSVKTGNFPSILFVNNQTYLETTRALYAGRSFVFCTWACFTGWVERILARDRKGGEELLGSLRDIIVHLNMQNSFWTFGNEKETPWIEAVQDSITQMFEDSSLEVVVQVSEPDWGNQLVVTEARITFGQCAKSRGANSE